MRVFFARIFCAYFLLHRVMPCGARPPSRLHIAGFRNYSVTLVRLVGRRGGGPMTVIRAVVSAVGVVLVAAFAVAAAAAAAAVAAPGEQPSLLGQYGDW